MKPSTHFSLISLFVPFCAILGTFAAYGADPAGSTLSLSQALHDANENSPTLQKSKSGADLASWKRVESYSGFLPKVNLQATHLLDKKYLLVDFPLNGNLMTIPQIVPSSNVALTAQLPIFDGFSNINKYSAAKYFESSAETEFNWEQFKTERMVTLHFYKVLGSQILRDVAEQNIKTLEDHLKEVKLFKSAGVSTNYDVLRVDVQMSEAESELLNSVDNINVERDQLNEALGFEADQRVATGKLPVLTADLIQNGALNDFSARGDLVSLEKKSQAFDSQEAAAGKYWVPKLSLFGEYDYYNNKTDGVFDGSAYRNGYQVGLALSWNIFDGLTSYARSKQSVQEHFQAEKDLQIGRIRAHQDLDYWKRKYAYFCSVYHSRIDDIEKSTESVRLAKEGRRAGVRTNTDLLDAELELFRARAEAVKAQVGSIEALIQIELATGKKLYTFNE